MNCMSLLPPIRDLIGLIRPDLIPNTEELKLRDNCFLNFIQNLSSM